SSLLCYNATPSTAFATLSLHDALPICMGVEGEATDDEQVEAHSLQGFFGGFLDLLRADGAKLGADGDGCPFDGAVLFGVFANSLDRKSTRLNSSHVKISYAVFCLKKKI